MMNYVKRETNNTFHQQPANTNTFLHAENPSNNVLPQQPEPHQQAPNPIDAMLNSISHSQYGNNQPKHE